MTLAQIEAAIPHRPPFLLVEEVLAQSENQILCRKHFTGEEWFFAGHYPDHPLVPGVILCEAALQAGAILLGHSHQATSQHVPVVTRMNDVRFKHLVRPGDTIEIEVNLREQLAAASFLTGKVSCAGKVAARLEFACMLVPASSDHSDT